MKMTSYQKCSHPTILVMRGLLLNKMNDECYCCRWRWRWLRTKNAPIPPYWWWGVYCWIKWMMNATVVAEDEGDFVPKCSHPTILVMRGVLLNKMNDECYCCHWRWRWLHTKMLPLHHIGKVVLGALFNKMNDECCCCCCYQFFTGMTVAMDQHMVGML